MASSHSPLLDSFDPFATHPFTNGSGLVPQPPQPSQYPVPIPSPHRPSVFSAGYAHHAAYTSSPSTVPSKSQYTPIRAPQPHWQPMSTSSSPQSPTKPIFVPFRKGTSSPELVLKKKSPTTKNAGTQTPGMKTSQ